MACRWSAPSHYLNQCWYIVNWTFGNKIQWNFNWNQYIFIKEKAFENVIYNMASTSSWPQYVNSQCSTPFHYDIVHVHILYENISYHIYIQSQTFGFVIFVLFVVAMLSADREPCNQFIFFMEASMALGQRYDSRMYVCIYILHQPNIWVVYINILAKSFRFLIP